MKILSGSKNTTIAVLISILAYCNCGGGGAVKLLESIVYGEVESAFFEYDNRNRIVKMKHYYDGTLDFTRTITYNENEITAITDVGDSAQNGKVNFTRNGDAITANPDYSAIEAASYICTVNKEGYPVKSEVAYGDGNEIIQYQYKGGNLIEVNGKLYPGEEREMQWSAQYSYDNKKSPFYCVNTPKWFLQIYYGPIGLHNNVTKGYTSHNIGRDERVTREYEYDSDGFPTRQILKIARMDASGEVSDSTAIWDFNYRGVPENHDPKTKSNQTLAADQALDFPPKINLFQFHDATLEARGSLYGFPNARIWGWPKSGKVAYSIEREIDGRGGQKIDFVIFDAITDTQVFEIKMDSYDYDEVDNNDYTDEALYNLFKDEILGALGAHAIVRQGTEFAPFPIRKNNLAYTCGIVDTQYTSSDLGFFDTIVSEYTVEVTAGSKKSIIGKFKPLNGITRHIYVCGYLLSPFENRALVVIAEEFFAFEGTELAYRFSGCHLDVGLK
jgi:hypothetical protein